MRKLLLILVVLVTLAALLELPSLAEGPNVGGRIFLNPTDRAVTVPVRLKSLNNQTRSDVVYTDQDGWYYFYGVPSGSYVLEVLVAKARGDWVIIVTSRPFPVIQNRYTRVPDVRLP